MTTVTLPHISALSRMGHALSDDTRAGICLLDDTSRLDRLSWHGSWMSSSRWCRISWFACADVDWWSPPRRGAAS